MPVQTKNENTEPTEANWESQNYSKNKGIFFKIFFDFFSHKYFLKDMGDGFGTYIKIDNISIKENNIFNIGDSFLAFSYKIYLNCDKNDKQMNNHKLLFLKIYSGDKELEPIILGKDKQLYTIGRGKNADITIKDKMLSRINCFIYYDKGIWNIHDGNQSGESSTNGTWLYAFEDIEIHDNMMFKSNKFNFCCKFASIPK